MIAALLLATSLVFGGVDQYVGSLSSPAWASSVSLLSAPWLLLGFVAGWSARTRCGAVRFGLCCTFTALLGYSLMTLSPMEGAHYSLHALVRLASSQSLVIAGGMVSGPLFGWFGHLWRTRRAGLGASLVALAFCLEPLAVRLLNKPMPSPAIAVEVLVGLVMVMYVGFTGRSTVS